MNDNEFAAPPLIWVVLPIVGGIATGVGLIVGLEWLGNRLTPKPYNSSTNAVVEAIHTAETTFAPDQLSQYR